MLLYTFDKMSSMKHIFMLIALQSLASQYAACNAQPPSSAPRIFVGSTPCDAVSRSLLNIPATDACEWIKWKLELTEQDNSPMYTLTFRYGLPRQGSREFLEGAKTVEWKGRWTKEPKEIYTLHTNQPGVSLALLKVDENVLHLLDKNKQLVVGNGGFSYSLNSVKPVAVSPAFINLNPTSLPSNLHSQVVGVYEGRTPCNHVLSAFYKLDAAECLLTKWRLTLFQDSLSHMPTDFKLESVYVGTGNETHVTRGKWAASRGMGQDRQALIYELQMNPEQPEIILRFLKGDDNVLFFLDKNNHPGVGNDYASYSLNRVNKNASR
jgi:hypothetical protein